MSQIWLLTVPNNKENSQSTFQAIQKSVNAGTQIAKLEIPNLVVGTLDTLMSLSDELNKFGMQVENVVRKVERQYAEIAGAEGESLRVNETTVELFLRKFSWDFAQYQYQGRQLTELVGQVQSMAAKVEEDLKLLSTACTEKSLALAAVKRKKNVNLTTSDLEDFLTPADIARLDVQDTDNLLTVLVVVPRQLENEFLSTYLELGSSIACYGGPDWGSTGMSRVGQNDGNFGPDLSNGRAAVKGSPVVPGSAVRVKEEGDSVMFAMMLLKGQYQAGTIVDGTFTAGSYVDYVEPLKLAFREKRFLMRDIQYDASKAGGVDGAIQQGEQELKQVRSTTLRWCKAHFGEVYSGWMHLKLIQAFVESVLRYGLPVDFTTILIQPNMRTEKELRRSVTNAIVELRPELKMKKFMIDEEEGDNDMENLPYVCMSLPIVGAGST